MKRTPGSKAVWLSFDLGIDGDYDGLYRWLDTQGALECGDNFAFFYFNAPQPSDFSGLLLASIKAVVELRKRDRLYAIFPKPEGGYRGRFIAGGRVRAVWDGRAGIGGEVDEP